MPSVFKALKRRAVLIPACLNLGAAVTLGVLPLTSDLDYEFAQLYGVISFWTSCITAWNLTSDSRLLSWKINVGTVGLVFCFTLAFLITCGCSFERGAEFFAVLVFPMMIAGTGFGLFCSRRRGRWIWLVGIVGVSFLLMFLDAWYRVPISLHSVVWGFYYGPVYDEVVPLTADIVWLQGMTVLFGLALNHLSAVTRLFSIRAFPAVVVLFVSVLVGTSSRRVGSYEKLTSVFLTSNHSSGPIQVYLDPAVDSLGANLLRRSLFFYDRVRAQLELQEAPPVKIFVFRDAAQKKVLFGAGETNFAKIWRNEIFVNAEDADGVIRHEMVHVLASQDGWPIWRIGLLEGLAVAVDWDEPYFTPHEWAAALQSLDRIPPLADWFAGTGFFSHHGRMSYILAGSFVRFLMDSQGISGVKALYRGAEFREVYGRPLAELDAQWRVFLKGQAISQDDVDWASVLLQKGIFERRCGHAIADLVGRAAERAAAGHETGAVEDYRAALVLDPDRIDVATEFARLAAANGNAETARLLVDDWLRKDIFPIRRAELMILRGDLWAQAGNADSATMAWTQCLRHFGRVPTVYVACHLRLSSSTGVAHWRDVRKLLEMTAWQERIDLFDRILARAPDLKVTRFWKGMTYFLHGQFDSTITVLEDPSVAFQDTVFEFRRRMMVVESLLREGRTMEAGGWLEGTLLLCRREVEIHRVNEWRAYMDWMKRSQEWD